MDSAFNFKLWIKSKDEQELTLTQETAGQQIGVGGNSSTEK